MEELALHEEDSAYVASLEADEEPPVDEDAAFVDALDEAAEAMRGEDGLITIPVGPGVQDDEHYVEELEAQGEPPAKPLPSTVAQIAQGWGAQQGNPANLGDWLDARFPNGGGLFPTTPGPAGVAESVVRIIARGGMDSAQELYGEDFYKLSSTEDRINRIRKVKNDITIKENQAVYDAGLDDSVASSIGGLAKMVVASPEMLALRIPQVGGKTLWEATKKVGPYVAGLGAEESILYQLAHEGTIDPKAVAVHMAQAVAFFTVPLSILKGAQRTIGVFSSEPSTTVVSQMSRKQARQTMKAMETDAIEVKRMATEAGADLSNSAVREFYMRPLETKWAMVGKDLAAFEKKAGRMMPVVTENFAKNATFLNQKGKGNWFLNGMDHFFGTLDTRIGNITEQGWGRMVNMEYVMKKRIHDASMELADAVRSLRKKPEIWKQLQDQAWDDVEAMLAASGDMVSMVALQKMRNTINVIGKDLVDVRFITHESLIPDYFPRMLRYKDKLFKAMGKEDQGILKQALKDGAKKLGKKVENLTEFEASHFVSQKLRGMGGKERAKSFGKKRQFDTIPEEFREFYYEPAQAYEMYIKEAIDEIESRRFFGMGSYKHSNMGVVEYKKYVTGLDAKDLGKALPEGKALSVDVERPEYIRKRAGLLEGPKANTSTAVKQPQTVAPLEITEKSIGRVINLDDMSAYQQTELVSLMQSRFGPGRRHAMKGVQLAKQASYLSLLANPIAAMKQFGDTAMSFAMNNAGNAAKTAAARFSSTVQGRKQIITAIDQGLAQAGQELIKPSGPARFLKSWLVNYANKKTGKHMAHIPDDVMMNITGFQGMDQWGKNLYMESRLLKYVNKTATKEGRAELYHKYGQAWGEEKTFALMKEMRNLSNGRGGLQRDVGISDILNEYMVTELLNAQPVTKMQMTQAYLNNPNMNAAYMLQTWTLKVLDVVRRESYNRMRNGEVAEGATNLAVIAVWLGSMNAGVKYAQDYVLGREVEVSPEKFVWDSWEALTEMMFYGKWTRAQIDREAVSGAWRTLAEPAPFSIGDDIWRYGQSLGSDDLEQKDRANANLMKRLPGVGRIYEQRWMGGNKKYDARVKEEKRKEGPVYKIQQDVNQSTKNTNYQVKKMLGPMLGQ